MVVVVAVVVAISGSNKHGEEKAEGMQRVVLRWSHLVVANGLYLFIKSTITFLVDADLLLSLYYDLCVCICLAS